MFKKMIVLVLISMVVAVGQGITVTMPNGGESWIVGNKHPVHWNWEGTITNVEIAYSTDGGGNWLLIASSTSNDGDYLWTIPNTVSTNCFVRVASVANPAINDLSDGSFTVARPTIDVKKPDGGNVIRISEYFPIHWDWTGQFTNVMIEYSTNSGSSWTTVIASTPNDGEYIWQVPNAPSPNCRIKITNTTDANCYGTSDGDFTISSNTITVIAPNGSEGYTAGYSYPIYWDWTGSIVNVKIDYSTDAGSTWISIVGSTPNDGSYLWTAPNTPSNNCRVQVSNTADPGCVDMSDANFSILSTGLQVITPNGGENYVVGDLCPIHWYWTGTISAVKLEYSSDGGLNWNQIVASTTNDGDYVWTVPNIPSNQCRVKITNTADINCWDASDGNFTVQIPTFSIFDPDSGKSLVAGEIYPIHWNWRGNVSSVKLELWYKTQSGVQWWLITAGTANDGSYIVTLPYYISDSCGIKITSNDDANSYDLSEVFRIVRPTITVTHPNGGEFLIEGDSMQINWNANGSFANVMLQYSIDGGLNWQTIIASTANDGDYLWEVPSGVWATCLLKVINTSDIDCYDMSDTTFVIGDGTITVTRPALVDTFFIKNKHPIRWKWAGGFPNVWITYTLGNITLSAPNTGYYVWTCDTFPLTNAVINVGNAQNSAIWDASDQFVIADTSSLIPYQIRVLAPLSCDTFLVGAKCPITWYSKNFTAPNQVTISYSINNGPWISIATVSNTQRSYLWDVPNYTTDSCRIRVQNTSGSDFFESGYFSIVHQQIQILYPTAASYWVVGKKYFIIWKTNGTFVSAVIDYSYDGGFSWVNIVSPTTNDGEYEWTIPNAPSNECLIRIRNYENPGVEAISETFTIWPQTINVTYPIASDDFIVGRKYYVTWDYQGEFALVNIEYSIDGGLNWTQVATNISNSQYYEWTIPNTPTDLAVVRVINAANTDCFGWSDTFAIIPQTITVTSPALNVQWIIGRKYYITWWYTGAFANVKIEYSTDGGNVWNTIIETVTNSGSYEWTIPNTPSNNCVVKVTNYSNLAVYDQSDIFQIPLQMINVTSPKTGDHMISGRKYFIVWQWAGTIATVNIQYSTDNGGSWINIVNNVTNSGSYEWTAPTVSSDVCLVKVINVQNPIVNDESELFSIHPQIIDITTPTSADIFISGRKYYITWRTVGSFSNADISYSLNGGQTWTSIATNVTNSGYYEWTLPEVFSYVSRIKVANTALPSVCGLSDTFNIIPPILAITSPALGNVWFTSRKYYITWNQLGGIAQVTLGYSLDGGGSYTQIVANLTNQGNYEWTIPSGATSMDARIKLTNSSNTAIFYTSDSFVIEALSIMETPANAVPTEFSLTGFVPNPFYEKGVIRLALPAPAWMKLLVYDISGRLIDKICEGTFSPGYHKISYGDKLSPGVYFLMMEVREGSKRTHQFVVKALKI